MQQILIISLNDNLSFFLKKQTVAGGGENYRIIRPGLFISQQERDNTVTVEVWSLPDLVDAEDDWEVSLFYL